jgi:malate synthase
MAREAIEVETGSLRSELGDVGFAEHRFEEARTLFEQVALSEDFVEFLTLPAYDLL